MPEPRRTAQPVEPHEGFVAVARVLGCWGIRGALKLESLSDFPERFLPGARLWLDGEEHRLEASHWRRGTLIAKLSAIDDLDTAAGLRGRLIEVPEAELHPLAEDEYYQHDLIGLAVRTMAGEAIGRVTGLLPTGANDVLIARGPAGEYLLPLIEDVVRRVDLSAGEIVVELREGLEPTPPRPESPRRRRIPSPSPKGRGK